MSKKKKKHRAAQKTPIKLDPNELEQRVHSELERGRYRQACELAKTLDKQSKGAHKPLLVDAYKGRFLEFLARGMNEPAKQILTNLEALLPPAELEYFQLKLAQSQGVIEAVPVQLWNRLTNEALPPDEADELAKLFVFSEEAPPEELQEHPEVRALLAVREGFAALCDGNEVAFKEALRQIPRNCHVADWKILLKGLNAWYCEATPQVAEALKRLPETGFLGLAARALAFLNDASAQTQSSPEVVSLALSLAGVEDPAVILKIEKEASKDSRKFLLTAFDIAYKSLPDFLESETGPASAIADYFTGIFRELPDEMNSAFENTLRRRVIERSFKKKRACAILRAGFNHSEPSEFLESLFLLQKLYEEALMALDAPEPLLARLHTRVAERLVAISDESPVTETNKGAVFAEAASILEQAREMDPEFAPAGIALASAYRRANETPKCNRLLDELAEQFPEDSRILLLAGEQCAKRKAYARAETHLRKALELDPVNFLLKRALVDTGIRRAVQYYQKQKPDRAREMLQSLEPMLMEPRTPADFILERRWFRLWQVALEEEFGDDAVAARMHQKSDEEWPNNLLMRDLCLTFLRKYLVGKNAHFGPAFLEEEKALQTLEPSDMSLLIELDQYAAKDDLPAPGSARAWRFECGHFLEKYLHRVVPERLSGIIDLLWKILDSDLRFTLPPHAFIESIRLWSKLDRTHPQLKLLRIAIDLVSTSGKKNANPLEDIEKAEKEARKRNDDSALRRAEMLRHRLQEMERPPPVPRPAFADELFDSDSDFEDEDEDGFDLEQVFDSFPPEIGESLRNMSQAWADGSPSIRRMIEREIKKSMPTEPAQVLIDLFKASETMKK